MNEIPVTAQSSELINRPRPATYVYDKRISPIQTAVFLFYKYGCIHMYMHTNRRRIQTQTNWTFDVDYRQRTTEFVPYFTSFTHWHIVPCKTKIEFPELQT